MPCNQKLQHTCNDGLSILLCFKEERSNLTKLNVWQDEKNSSMQKSLKQGKKMSLAFWFLVRFYQKPGLVINTNITFDPLKLNEIKAYNEILDVIVFQRSLYYLFFLFQSKVVGKSAYSVAYK